MRESFSSLSFSYIPLRHKNFFFRYNDAVMSLLKLRGGDVVSFTYNINNYEKKVSKALCIYSRSSTACFMFFVGSVTVVLRMFLSNVHDLNILKRRRHARKMYYCLRDATRLREAI